METEFGISISRLYIPVVSERQCKVLDQASSCLSGVTTSHITPVHPILDCGKGECEAPVTHV